MRFGLIKEKHKLNAEIENLNDKPPIDFKPYFDKIKRIKSEENYTEIERRNTALSDLELLTIILYCYHNEFCYEMRKPQRDDELISCEWKRFYCNLCCAVYKIHKIFHLDNPLQIKINTFYHGNCNPFLNKKQQLKLTQKTVSSWSTNWGVARAFLDSVADHGMLWIMENVNQSLNSQGSIRQSVLLAQKRMSFKPSNIKNETTQKLWSALDEAIIHIFESVLEMEDVSIKYFAFFEYFNGCYDDDKDPELMSVGTLIVDVSWICNNENENNCNPKTWNEILKICQKWMLCRGTRRD